jgi:hypothetical protein
MNDRPSSTPSSDDLEIGPLLVRIVLLFKTHGRKLIVGSVLGMLIGCFIYWLMPRGYEAQMIVQSSVISNVQGLHVITSWDKLLNKSGYPVVAGMFGMRVDEVEKMTGLTGGLISGNDDAGGGIVIGIRVSDTLMLPVFQQGFVHALETNNYIRQRVEVRKQGLEAQLAQAKQELQKLDSVTPYLRKFSESEPGAAGKFIVDVSNVSIQRLACEDRIAAFVEKLQFTEAVYILQGLTRSKTGKLVPSPILPLLGLIIGFLVSYAAITYTVFHTKYLAAVKMKESS